jgi:hypothetical protein
VKRIVVGLVLLLAGAAGLIAFREPVGTYTVEVTGSGDDAGELVEAECVDGVATGQFEGDERAESECALAEDSVKTIRIVKLAVAAIVALIGVWLIYAGYRRWWRDFRSGRAYKRMVKDHDLPSRRRDVGAGDR